MAEVNYRNKKIKLRSQITLPAIGFGTYRINCYEILYKTMDKALAEGYRLFDTASTYGNEEQIGRSLNHLLSEHNLKREDLFITTKLSPHASAKSVRRAFHRSLSHLGLDYVDMYLIHFPGYKDEHPKSLDNQKRRIETWLAIVKLYEEGKIRAIGVSNFTVKHLRELNSVMAIKPMINQVEHHPYYVDTNLIQYCNEHKIKIQAYASFGGKATGKKELVEDPVVVKIAERYSATSYQVLLAWSLQRGIAVLPKSKNQLHMRENMSINFKLSERDMLALDALSVKNKKYSWDSSHIN